MPQFICAALLVLLSICSVAMAEEAKPAAAAAQPASQAPSQIQGSVQQSQVQATASPSAEASAAPLTAADYLDIQVQPGMAKNHVQEFTLTLNNKHSQHVEVLQLEVLNGMDEQTYVMMQQQQSQAKRRMAGGMLRGLAGVASSFVPYAGYGGYATYHAVSAGTYAASRAVDVAADAMESSPGGVNYSGRVVQRASNIYLSPSQPFQCLAVVPEQQKPVVRVVFKDLQTNQIFDIQK